MLALLLWKTHAEVIRFSQEQTNVKPTVPTESLAADVKNIARGLAGLLQDNFEPRRHTQHGTRSSPRQATGWTGELLHFVTYIMRISHFKLNSPASCSKPASAPSGGKGSGKC